MYDFVSDLLMICRFPNKESGLNRIYNPILQ